MTPDQILESINTNHPEAVLSSDFEAPEPFIVIDPEHMVDVCGYLKSERKLGFDSLMCLTGIDYEDKMEVVYNLHSLRHDHKITLKVELTRDEPKAPSVMRVWRAADWHEREAYDLLGIVFEGHPDLRRILLPSDWEGHPLRKDHTDAEKYRGWTIKKVKEN